MLCSISSDYCLTTYPLSTTKVLRLLYIIIVVSLIIVATSSLSAIIVVKGFHLLPTHHRTSRRQTVRSSMTTPHPSSASSSMLEVEEKFAIQNRNVDDLTRQLQTLGFENTKKKIEMVDWYFDDNRNYTLLKNDCWLRCRTVREDDEVRHSSSSQWELKQGRHSLSAGSGSGRRPSTVYEETEGDHAVEAAYALLLESNERDSRNSQDATVDNDDTTTFEGYTVPALPPVSATISNKKNRPHLSPFARIYTQRSSWNFVNNEASSTYHGLSVDLDTTDFDYAVGEVETLVVAKNDSCTTDDTIIDTAREQVHALIQELVRPTTDDAAAKNNEDDSSSQQPMGKLEFYLHQRRPELYQLCIESGVLQREKNAQG